jgi:tripartite-type tricarboxylate transporter receptor subunit TctC
MANTQHTINPILFARLPYDALRDFAPVGLTSSVYFALTVHPSVPAASVKEFIAVARARPGDLTYASAGTGAPHHLAMEQLMFMARVKLTHIPYKGAGQLVPALIAGEVTSVIGAINSLLPHVRSGRLRMLAMAGTRRAPLLPDVPTIAEAALPGFALENWNGILVPAGTPRPVIDRLNAEIGKALRDPEVRDRLVPQGIELIPSTPEEFQEVMKTHMAKWEKIIRAANIRVE